MLITRTITTYKATAYDVKVDDDFNADVQQVGVVEFTGTSASAAQARKVFKEHGIKLPKGSCKIKVEEVESKTYGCTLEKFMEVASEM